MQELLIIGAVLPDPRIAKKHYLGLSKTGLEENHRHSRSRTSGKARAVGSCGRPPFDEVHEDHAGGIG